MDYVGLNDNLEYAPVNINILKVVKTLICKIPPILPCLPAGRLLPKGGITPLWQSIRLATRWARGDFPMPVSIQF